LKFCGVLFYGLEILSELWNIWIFFLNIDIWNPKLFKNCTLCYLFCIFFLSLWHFFSYFSYLYLSKNSREFCSVLLYRLEILSKNSGKIWIFVFKIEIFEIQLFSKFNRFLIVVLFFFSIFDTFFSISSIYTCQKIEEVFVVFYCMD